MARFDPTDFECSVNRVKAFPFSAWVYRQRNAVERFFQQAQALQGRRHPIRQALRQFSRFHPTRLNPHLVAEL
jgi:transposase